MEPRNSQTIEDCSPNCNTRPRPSCRLRFRFNPPLKGIAKGLQIYRRLQGDWTFAPRFQNFCNLDTMQMQFPNPPQSIAILHIPGRCSLSQFPEDCGRVTQCQSIPTNPLTIQTVAPRFQSVCNPGSWPVQILRQFPSSQHNQWPFHKFQRQSRDPPLILAHSTRIASGSQVCTGLQVDWKHCIKLCGLQAHSWIQLQSATISPNVLPVLWIVPFFCNPDTMQLDFESIPKSDAIFYNLEDCKRVARFLSIPVNPWTILQPLCHPFRFVSSIGNRSILGITAKTARHQLHNSKLWDANPCHNWHNQY